MNEDLKHNIKDKCKKCKIKMQYFGEEFLGKENTFYENKKGHVKNASDYYSNIIIRCPSCGITDKKMFVERLLH